MEVSQMFKINSLRSGLSSLITIAVIAASSGVAAAQTLPYSRDGVLIPLEQINPTDYPDAFYTGNRQPRTDKMEMLEQQANNPQPAVNPNLPVFQSRGTVLPRQHLYNDSMSTSGKTEVRSQSYLDLTRHSR
jgi:hypothetical protein